jgi:WD40-like Beta Propeller Repeat
LRTRFNEANAAFSPDGKWLAFTADESGQTEIYLQRFQAATLAGRWPGVVLSRLAVPMTLGLTPVIGQPAPWFAIATKARAAIRSSAGFDVSADRRHFLIPLISSAPGPGLVVVQDWEAALGRK